MYINFSKEKKNAETPNSLLECLLHGRLEGGRGLVECLVLLLVHIAGGVALGTDLDETHLQLGKVGLARRRLVLHRRRLVLLNLVRLRVCIM